MLYNPQLETFISVAEAGSFSKAAEKLFISPPAVIKQINILENNLNLKLFERTHRGLVITAAGKSLYRDAKYLISYSKDSLERARSAMHERDEEIRVGISPMTPPEIFLKLWPRIQKAYPTLKLKLVTFENTPENAREILAHMGQNIDVVVGIFDEAMVKYRDCAGTEISREPFCVCVPLSHPLAQKEILRPSDLFGERLMVLRKGYSSSMDAIRKDLSEHYPEIRIVDFDFYNVEAFNRCENNQELLLGFQSWASVHPLLKIIPVDWPHAMPYGILHAKSPAPKVRKLIQAIEKLRAASDR